MKSSDEVIRRATTRGFMLVEPSYSKKETANSTARQLAMQKGVRKVYVTSGKYGFVIETNGTDAFAVAKSGRSSNAKSGIHLLQCHFSYWKRH